MHVLAVLVERLVEVAADLASRGLGDAVVRPVHGQEFWDRGDPVVFAALVQGKLRRLLVVDVLDLTLVAFSVGVVVVSAATSWLCMLLFRPAAISFYWSLPMVMMERLLFLLLLPLCRLLRRLSSIWLGRSSAAEWRAPRGSVAVTVESTANAFEVSTIYFTNLLLKLPGLGSCHF